MRLRLSALLLLAAGLGAVWYIRHLLEFGTIVFNEKGKEATYRVRRIPSSLLDLITTSPSDSDASYLIEIRSGHETNSTYRAYWSSWNPKRIWLTEDSSVGGAPTKAVLHFDDSYRIACEFQGRSIFLWRDVTD